LSDRITASESDEYTARFPDQRWAEVTVVLRDGRRFSSGPTTAVGDQGHPLTDAALTAKFHALADGPLAMKRSAAIATGVRRLTDPAADLQQFFEPILSPRESPAQPRPVEPRR